MTVVIGIDPHKASHTATAIGPGSVEAATIRLRAARSTPEELLSWAAQWPERRWAVEGARGLGQLLAQQLVAAGEHVTDVPATLSARVRTLETGHGRKTDHIDARAVALVAAQRPDLPRVTADDHCRVLRLLADRRDELTSERRRTINRLHRHLRDLIAGGAPTQLNAKTAAALLAKVRPRDGVEAERKQMARDLLVDVRRLDRAIAQNRRRCAAAVAAAAPAFATWRGSATCSPPRSSATSATSAASPAPTASPATRAPHPSKPAAATSCATDCHATATANSTTPSPLAAHTQTIRPGPGRDYYQRRRDTGNSRNEALRLLKRQLTKTIYRTLLADADRTRQNAPT